MFSSFSITFLLTIFAVIHFHHTISAAVTDYAPVHVTPPVPTPLDLCRKCFDGADSADPDPDALAQCEAGVHACEAGDGSGSEMTMSQVGDEERARMCKAVTDKHDSDGDSEGSEKPMYCEGLKLLFARGLADDACHMDYVMLNGLELNFLAKLDAKGYDVMHHLQAVFETRYAHTPKHHTSKTAKTYTRRAVASRQIKSLTTRPIADMIFSDEEEYYRANVRKVFEELRSQAGNEHIKMEVKNLPDGRVYVRLYFEEHHVVEF